MTISSIIIDDEPIARKGIEGYVKKTGLLNLIGSYSNPDKVEKDVLLSVDLIFLDIKLHKQNGLDFYKELKPNAPFAIVISAYADYALDGFELNVADYLLKPVSFERFEQAVLRVKELKSLKQTNQMYYDTGADYFFIKCDNRIQKIFYDDILYIEGLSNYVAINTVQKKYLTYLSLNLLLSRLPANKFIRIHKSYAIAINKVESIKNYDVSINGNALPVSKSYREGFMKLIEGKLLKK